MKKYHLTQVEMELALLLQSNIEGYRTLAGRESDPVVKEGYEVARDEASNRLYELLNEVKTTEDV